MTITYYSSTTSSTTSNPPINFEGGLADQSTTQETGTLGWLHGNNVWFYSSTNAPSDLTGVNAITDANLLGIKVGDVVIGVTSSGGSTTPVGPWIGVWVATAGSTNPGGLMSTAGGQISSNWLSST